MSDRQSPMLMTILAIGIAILYIPMLVMIGYSFNTSPLVGVWGGFSTRWYAALAGNDQLMSAAWLSLRVGFVAATGAMVLGTLAAIALVRFKSFHGRLALTAMVNAPGANADSAAALRWQR